MNVDKTYDRKTYVSCVNVHRGSLTTYTIPVSTVGVVTEQFSAIKD